MLFVMGINTKIGLILTYIIVFIGLFYISTLGFIGVGTLETRC